MKDNSALKWLRFAGIAIQMGAIIWLGSLLGAYLDKKFLRNDELYYKIVTLLAVFLAMAVVIREVIKAGKSE
jgi:MFS-type transporter involved in bile tolerance (Atg22 family)